MLAVKRLGRVLGSPEPPVMETRAQFMYISRLPMLLNQVHARIALPLLASGGIVKERPWLTQLVPEPSPVQGIAIGFKLRGALVGHPPTKL